MYNEATIRDFSVSGTTSMFAAYRIGQELDGFAPDIAFIEFAVNDDGMSRAQQVTYTDAVIDRLREANPDVLVVYVATTQARHEADRRAGTVPATVAQTREAAEQNQAVFIDAGAAVWREVIDNGRELTDFLGDGVHPTADGDELYFQVVKDELDAFLADYTPTARARSTFGSQTGLVDARLVDVADASGCRETAALSNVPYHDKGLECQRGESFELTFTGTTFGVVQATYPDSGVLECTIDGVPQAPQNFRLGNPSATRPGRHIRLLFTDLPNGEHRLRCTATQSAVDPSRDRIAITRFLISSETLLTF